MRAWKSGSRKPTGSLDAPQLIAPSKVAQHKEESLSCEQDVKSSNDTQGDCEDGRKRAIDNDGPAKSWYRGSWPRPPKRVALGEAFIEKTSVAGGTTSEVTEDDRASRSSRTHLLCPGSSTRSLPAVATMTKLTVGSDSPKTGDLGEETRSALEDESNESKKLSASPEEALQERQHSELDERSSRSSWLNWLIYRRSLQNESESPMTESPVSNLPQNSPAQAENHESIPTESRGMLKDDDTTNGRISLPWFSKWTSRTHPKMQAQERHQSIIASNQSSDLPDLGRTEAIDNGAPIRSVDELNVSNSSWAFWSRSAKSSSSPAFTGQLAIEGSDSQRNPEPAVLIEESPQSIRNTNEDSNSPKLVETALQSEQASSSVENDSTKKLNQSDINAKGDRTIDREIGSKRGSDLILPTFESTYGAPRDNQSVLQQVASWVSSNTKPTKIELQSRMLLKEPRRIKRALAIGVHGYFPVAIVQSVIGKPTGTSVRFAENAAQAIKEFSRGHGYEVENIEKIALEGEGKIEERLDILWKLLLNWIDHIRQADFILLAAHSQGVPVAVSLVAKLISFGCVTDTCIGICAIAGISEGPFAEYRSRWISGSAGELFDFSDPKSLVSTAYLKALESVLQFGAKLLYVGSLDDQLVPLHSSTFEIVNHPNIYRAVFVDGRIHVADFLTHLVGFALKLRNLNISDHGLVRELSKPLAGSLVGGQGHSSIYEFQGLYSLAIQFALQTKSDNMSRLHIEERPTASGNPFILPFAMRGVLEEPIVRDELAEEVGELLRQFDGWKPSTRSLKDVKYRLEGIRSRLRRQEFV